MLAFEGWDAAGKGTAIPDRLLRWYLNRHAARMFAGSGNPMPPRVRAVAPPSPSRVDAAASALARAEQPLLGPAADRDVGTVTREAQRAAETDAGTAARDQRRVSPGPAFLEAAPAVFTFL